MHIATWRPAPRMQTLRSAERAVKRGLSRCCLTLQLIFPPPPSSAAVIIAALHILNGYPLRLPAAGDLGTHRVIEVRRPVVEPLLHMYMQALPYPTQQQVALLTA